MEYNDGLQSRGRTPRLYLLKGSKFVKFAGQSIDGYCSVITEKYQKNGKWSNTTYQIDCELRNRKNLIILVKY